MALGPAARILGGGDVARDERERPGVGEVERALQIGVDGVDEVAHAADAPGLVGDEIVAPADQQAQLGNRVVLERHQPEVGGAQAELVGDDPSIARVAFGLTTHAALTRPIDGEPRHMHQLTRRRRAAWR